MGAEHTFLFADLAGFTALTEVHGDEEAADLAGEFVEVVRELLREHGGEEVKCIGDAVMIRCGDAGRGVRLGVRIVEEVGSRPGFPSVRVGINTGPAVERRGDWFGAAVNLAARISGAAGGGEVLVGDATRAAAGDLQGIHFLPRGRRSLRNVAEPVSLFAAAPEAERSALGLPVDPVCRMVVDVEHAAGTLSHGGTEYFFCSLDCARAFAEDPARYATRSEGAVSGTRGGRGG